MIHLTINAIFFFSLNAADSESMQFQTLTENVFNFKYKFKTQKNAIKVILHLVISE